jgi:sugar-specific transcriptional regulator TrmB
MLKTLLDSSVNIKEAQLYVHLAENGPQNVIEIATELKVNKRRAYHVVKLLRERHFIIPCSTDCSSFEAVPFNKVLDLLLQSRLDEARRLETVYRFVNKER